MKQTEQENPDTVRGSQTAPPEEKTPAPPEEKTPALPEEKTPAPRSFFDALREHPFVKQRLNRVLESLTLAELINVVEEVANAED